MTAEQLDCFVRLLGERRARRVAHIFTDAGAKGWSFATAIHAAIDRLQQQEAPRDQENQDRAAA